MLSDEVISLRAGTVKCVGFNQEFLWASLGILLGGGEEDKLFQMSLWNWVSKLCIHVLPALKLDIYIHLSTFLTPIKCLALSSQRWATGSFYHKITYYVGSMCVYLFNLGEPKKVFTSKGVIF